MTRRIATGIPAVALATGTLLAAGIGIGSAAPSGYPGGSSSTSFNHHTYHVGQHVHAHTGHNFKSHDRVTETLVCRRPGPNHKRHLGHDHANSHGGVNTTFKLHHSDWGHCTLYFRGHGASSSGSFKVKKH